MKSIICAIVKNEQRFIREWTEYYLSIGFDKLYIFEDFGSDSHENIIKDLIDDGKVELNSASTIIHQYVKGTMGQRELYSKFLERCKEENLADWCGFFDVDEFISFEEGYNLERIEEEFNDYGGILLSWRIYGANGHIKRPEGKVIDNYTTYLPDNSLLIQGNWQWNVKSMVNVKKCNGLNHIHWFKGCKLTDMTDGGHLSFEKAWINHYYSKSWEDYLDRIFSRGNMNNNLRCLDLFFDTNPDMLPLKEKLVYEQRYRETASTMWISRKMKIIAGGNVHKLRDLNNGK